MGVILPLDRMTLSEKIQALEDIWDDLCRNAEGIPSPAWHGQVLQEREASIEQGKESFLDWERAKQAIRESVG